MLTDINTVLENIPSDWLKLTTHRLDIYNEKLAKVQFLEEFEALSEKNDINASSLAELPTAYDYIRLGHPLSCLLEWFIAKSHDQNSAQVISFASQTIGILAILRQNALDKRNTQILHKGELPQNFDPAILKDIYDYSFELMHIDDIQGQRNFEGSTILVCKKEELGTFDLSLKGVDFLINYHSKLGSIVMVNGEANIKYISAIQHVRRRETIAMTPANAVITLKTLSSKQNTLHTEIDVLESSKSQVLASIKDVTSTVTQPLVGSSGLSIQYAILMGLIHDAKENYKGKAIKIIVPPNCYGGTNDQSRRVAASIKDVEVLDLPVDGGNDMVQGINTVLDKVALMDAVPLIIAEIPTNPRVEVPDLSKLEEALSKKRKTQEGKQAIDPVFILDQTFCPNVKFIGKGGVLSNIKCISFSSGSKFPSGGLCTAGYCVGNEYTIPLMKKIEAHLMLCDNEATNLQYEILAKQMPSMLERVAGAYKNTREFVKFIKESLPGSKVNFVSEELAAQGFTPSVFSLDLPTKGSSDEERESHKRSLNLKLINMMITEIPEESKFCVSYGQLKGCYWTIPATSTQGTTKEDDKDYIVRASVSHDLDLDKHKKVFLDFVNKLEIS